jgi:hypothetical protein
MAYTRWSSSNWYSFYNSIGDNSTLEEQVLSLWHTSEQKSFTYSDLLTMGEKKLKSIYPEADNDDILEALSIIERFKADALGYYVDDMK